MGRPDSSDRSRRAESQEFFQYGMVIVVPIIYSERQGGQVCDRDITQPGLARLGDVRVQGIPESGFDKGKRAFNALGEILLVRDGRRRPSGHGRRRISSDVSETFIEIQKSIKTAGTPGEGIYSSPACRPWPFPEPDLAPAPFPELFPEPDLAPAPFPELFPEPAPAPLPEPGPSP